MASRIARGDRNSALFGIGMRAAALLLVTALAACAPMPSKKPSGAQMAQPAVAAVAADQDLLLKLLAAQFALQGNDLQTGAQGYADAAMLTNDPLVSEEATRLALSVRQWALAKRALTRWQELAPKDPGVLQARAWIALGEKRSDDAYVDLDAIAARADEQSWRLIAQTLLGAEDKTAAAQLLDRLATSQHLATKERNWVAVSQLAFKLGDKALAQRLADTAVTKFHGGDSYAWSARLAIDRGDKAAAREKYAEALQRDPKSLRLRGGYAALLADSGDNAAASRALANGPQDDTTYGARAAYASRADDKVALAALYRELVADTAARSGKRLYLMGQIAELVDKRSDALEWYRGINDDDEHWFDAQTREAVLLDQLGHTDQALDFLHQLQAQTVEDSEQLGNAYLLEAEILSRRQRPRDATAVYTRALGTLPDDPRLLYARALLAAEQGRDADAEHDLRRVIELKPDDAEAMNALGYTLADGSSKGDAKLNEARDLIRRAIELKPNEAAIIDSLGWVHYRMGDLDASLTQLRRAYEKQPDADIAAHLGEVLWVKGERDEARKVWDEGRRKDPKNKALLEAIQRLAT
jgi:tetratricopeptide (TPR) repeat protein